MKTIKLWQDENGKWHWVVMKGETKLGEDEVYTGWEDVIDDAKWCYDNETYLEK